MTICKEADRLQHCSDTSLMKFNQNKFKVKTGHRKMMLGFHLHLAGKTSPYSTCERDLRKYNNERYGDNLPSSTWTRCSENVQYISDLNFRMHNQYGHSHLSHTDFLRQGPTAGNKNYVKAAEIYRRGNYQTFALVFQSRIG